MISTRSLIALTTHAYFEGGASETRRINNGAEKLSTSQHDTLASSLHFWLVWSARSSWATLGQDETNAANPGRRKFVLRRRPLGAAAVHYSPVCLAVT